MIIKKEFFSKSLLAGIFISIGCIANIKVSGILGPILFAFGLLTVCSMQANLFTGKAGFVKSKTDYLFLIPMLLFNIGGCFLIGNGYPLDCSHIIDARLSSSIFSLLVTSIFTGIVMTTAVSIYKNQNSPIGILLGVPLFILCGFPHCIADGYYYTCEGWTIEIFLIWLVTVVGNFIGCSYNKLIKSGA